MLVDDGQIVVLGRPHPGRPAGDQDKVPLLGDIPYLGALFQYESRNRKRTNLMVFLRPVVLKDDKAAAALTADRYEYIRNLQGEMKLPLERRCCPSRACAPLPPLEAPQKQPLGTAMTARSSAP